MLEFHDLTLSDKEPLAAALRLENSRSCDCSLSCIYSWSAANAIGICFCGSRFVALIGAGGSAPVFSFPYGEGELKGIVQQLRETAAGLSSPLVLTGLEEKHVQLLEDAFPGCFIFSRTEERDEYIYLAEKLSTFSGKALHGKKNHCNRFEAEHDWHFEPLDSSLTGECLEMQRRWLADNSERLEEGVHDDLAASEYAFSHFDELGLEGGILYADGSVVGFAAGSVCSSDCFDLSFEKARPEINGAYSMVCRETAKLVLGRHPELVYINREDDAGSEGLRKSKLSYRPEFMLKKYTARWNCG